MQSLLVVAQMQLLSKSEILKCTVQNIQIQADKEPNHLDIYNRLYHSINYATQP